MKKLSALLMAIAMSFAIVSCGTGDVAPIDETTAQTESGTVETNAETENGGDITPSDNSNGYLPVNHEDFYKIEVFSLPEGDFRQVIVDYMRKQSDIEWVCSGDFSVSEKWENWGISLDFKKGVKYKGIPYADTKVSYTQFMDALVDGTYTSDSDKWKDVYGVQCISSIMNSLQQFCPDVSGTSNVMMPSYDTFEASILGDYKVPKGVNRTFDIIVANGEEVMYEQLAKLKKGDIIMTKDDTAGTSHFRVVVEDPIVVRNPAGKVNPSKSTVKTIEQTNKFDSTRKDGVNTTWYVDHTYTFKACLEKNYIPLTLEIYNKDRSECQIPYIALDKEITSEILAKQTFSSSVKSNFPIRYVYMDAYDKAGNLVNRGLIYDMESTYNIGLRANAQSLFGNLPSGDYTFVLTVGIAAGDAELARVDFTLAK